MRIYIAVVSHGHFDLIKELECVPNLSQDEKFTICVLDNTIETGFEQWCFERGIEYLNNQNPKGFGENNNKIFNFIKEKFALNLNDKFLILNPDVVVDAESLIALVEQSNIHNAKISTINLYKDRSYTVYDNGVRNFPNFSDYMQSMFLGRNPSIIDKAMVDEPCYVDWAAGSFLLFDASHFETLKGFDTDFYMYCEDIDICLRSNLVLEEKVLYSPNIKAVHLAQHASRSIFSKHIYWHLSSMFRYLFKKRKLQQLERRRK